MIAAPSMVAMFENFVSVTQEEDVPQVAARSVPESLTRFKSLAESKRSAAAFCSFKDVLLVSSGSVGLVCICGAFMSSLGWKRALREERCRDGPAAQSD